MRHYGLDAGALVRGIERVMGISTGIDEAALASARIDAVHSAVKAEALCKHGADDNRFRVRYRLKADDPGDAESRAIGIALEQTVEIPGDIVPEGYIRDEIVGQVEHIAPLGGAAYEVVISYSPDSAGDEVIQLLNVVFGNSSIQQNIRVVGFDPGPVIRARFAGPRFGIAGVRARTGRTTGGLISPVIKPQGSSVSDLAEIARRCVLGGADIIKDDHGLANQTMAPFRDRVVAVSEAVAEANAKCGGSARYFVNVTGHSGYPVDEAFQAKEAGAGGVLADAGADGLSAWCRHWHATNPSICRS
jgi:ribulose-bisphosphate carboxylase large chain